MKFQIENHYLIKALKSVSSAQGGASILGLLSSVALESSEDAITFSSTNLDQGFAFRAPALIEEPGVACVGATESELERWAATLNKDSSLTFTLGEKNKVESVFDAKTLDVYEHADFPRFPTEQGGVVLSVLASELARAVALCAPCASRHEDKTILCGVLFEWTEDILNVVGTDTYRLAVVTLQCEGKKAGNFVLPNAAAGPLQTLLALAGEGERVEIEHGNGVVFRIGAHYFSSRLFDGQYVKWRRAVPENHPNSVQLNRAEFEGAVRRVLLASDPTGEKAHGIECRFDTDKNKLTIFASSGKKGQSLSVIDAQFASGSESIVMNFQGRYFAEMLADVRSCQTIDLAYDAPSNQVLLTSPQGRNWRYVIMRRNKD